MDVKLTKLDCENIYIGWKEKHEYDSIADCIKTLNPLEAMKLTRQLILFHDETGGIINQMINFCIEKSDGNKP